MLEIAIKKENRKYVWIAVSILLISIFIISWIVMGFLNSLLGIITAIPLYFISYAIKFGLESKINLKTDYSLLIIPLILVLSVTYVWYSAFTLNSSGEIVQGVVLSTSFHMEQTSGDNGAIMYYEVYDCQINNYPKQIECTKSTKKGDTVRYFYAKALTTGFVTTPPFLVERNKSKFQAILDYGGVFYLGSILYGVAFFITWFISLYNRGVRLLNEKNCNEQSQFIKVTYTAFYLLSYITFILFVLALFKNIYLIFYQKYWNLTLTTLGLLIILVTDLGERLFEYSTTIILELKSYKAIKFIKNIVKISGYVGFLLLLWSSLRHNDKNIFDLVFEFLNKSFGINIKSLLDWFTQNKK